jgi:uncharacterized protein YjbK
MASRFFSKQIRGLGCVQTITTKRNTDEAWRFDETNYESVTKLDLELRYKAHKYDSGRARVDLLLKDAKSKPHPDYPSNAEMRLYRVLKDMTDGNRNRSGASTTITGQGV